MNALEFLKSITHVPMFIRNEKPIRASNGDRKRWLNDSAVLINGTRPKPQDTIEFPVTELVFFPKSEKLRVTMA